MPNCLRRPTMTLWYQVHVFLRWMISNIGFNTTQRIKIDLQKRSGVTGQNIPRPNYTRVYYGLRQFIPRDIFWPRPIHTPQAKLYPQDINNNINSVER